jgi:hypothetical protein
MQNSLELTANSGAALSRTQTEKGIEQIIIAQNSTEQNSAEQEM